MKLVSPVMVILGSTDVNMGPEGGTPSGGAPLTNPCPVSQKEMICPRPTGLLELLGVSSSLVAATGPSPVGVAVKKPGFEIFIGSKAAATISPVEARLTWN